MKYILTFLYLITFCFASQAQQFPLTYYSTQEGLPNTLVTDIFQDKKGFIWIATQSSNISKFSNGKFINYGKEHGLDNALVKTVIERKEGELFIGTYNYGIYKLENESAERFNKESIPEEIYNFFKDDEENIWVASGKGLIKILKNDSIEWFYKNHNLPEYYVTHVNKDKDGNIWFGYDEKHGLYKYNFKGFEKFDASNGLTNGRIINSFHDSESNTWITAHDGLYLIKKDQNFARKIETKGLPNYYLFDILEISDEELLISSQSNGLIFFNKKQEKVVKILNHTNGLKVNTITRLFKDVENNIWMSNWGEGLVNIHFSGLEHYSKREGLNVTVISDIEKYEKSFAVTSANQIFKFEDSKFTPFHSLDESVYKFGYINGKLYCAREKDFLIIDKNNNIKKLTDSNLKSIRGIAKNKKDEVYVASWGEGISKEEDKGKFVPIKNEITATESFYYCAFSDKKGRLWFGTWDSGVIMCDGEKWQQWTEKDGLPSNKITAIEEDKNDNIILGTNGGGIAILQEGKVKSIINLSNGLSSNSIFSLAIDNKNNLWAGAQGALNKINLDNYTLRKFDVADGFIGDCTFNSLLAYENDIWVGTNNYLWRYNEKYDIKKQKNLQVFIENITVNYQKKLPLNENIELKYFENKINFEFDCSQIHNYKDVEYYYKFSTGDNIFQKLGKQKTITFYELPPGDYSLEIKACINNTCSEKNAKYNFIILSPWWQTIWFRLSLLFSILIAIYVFIKWRTKRLFERQKELKNLVKIRTEEVEKQKTEAEKQRDLATKNETEAKRQKNLVEEKNKEILDSINYAKRIQTAILPPPRVVKSFLDDSFILYLPKDIVAGDFYWMESVEVNEVSSAIIGSDTPTSVIGSDTPSFVIASNEGAKQSKQSSRKILFAAADCTGHGVPGAMVSVICNNGLNRSVREYGNTEPGKILDKTREIVIEEFQKSEEEVKDGMDIALCSLESKDGCFILQYSGANNPLWVIKKGSQEIEEIKANKQPIGKYADHSPFTTHVLELEKEDSIYIFTDGFQDQFGGEKGKKFKPANLRKLILSAQNLPMPEQRDVLLKAFDEWKGQLEQVDDVCVIGVRL